MKNIITFIFGIFAALSLLTAVSCREETPNIDQELWKRIQQIVDSEPDNKKTLKVIQYDFERTQVYYISRKYVDTQNFSYMDDTGLEAGIVYHLLPTDIREYKGRRILFKLLDRAPIQEREVIQQIQADSKNDSLRVGEIIDYRVWIYMKDKCSGRTAFVSTVSGVPLESIPELRYLNDNPKDSSQINMYIAMCGNSIYVHGKKHADSDSITVAQVGISVMIENKTDSVMYIGLGDTLYGNFVLKNGSRLIPFGTTRADWKPFYKKHKGMYFIQPQSGIKFRTYTHLGDSVMSGESLKVLAGNLNELLFDSLYYMPSQCSMPVDTAQQYRWSNEYKVYVPPVVDYIYYIDDVEDKQYSVYFVNGDTLVFDESGMIIEEYMMNP